MVHIAPVDEKLLPRAQLPMLKGNIKVEGGFLKQMTHWSESCQCNMTFSIFMPEAKDRLEKNPPVLYYLSGKQFHSFLSLSWWLSISSVSF